MENDRIVKIIYQESRRRMETEEAARTRGEEVVMTDTWCAYTKKLMRELHFEQEWAEERVPPEEEWNEILRERIHDREQIKWRTHCLLKPKLRTYAILKKELRTEPYLEVHHRGGIPELAKLRGGTNRLRIEQGRYKKEKVEERVCEFCDSKEVEDEKHFMLECKMYNDFREEMWRKFEETTGTSRTDYENAEQKLNALIGDKFQPKSSDNDKNSSTSQTYRKIARTIMEYVTKSMKRRRRQKQ